MRKGVGLYRRSGQTWHDSSSILGSKSLLWPNIPSIGSGRSGKTEIHGGE